MRRIDANASTLSQRLEESAHVLRQGTLEPQMLAGPRMLRTEHRRMEGLTPEPRQRLALLLASRFAFVLEA